MKRRTHHRGYVLLLTLLMLAIAAAALAGVCRMSLQKAVQATRAQDDLQRRWGVLSCRAALIPKAQTALGPAPERSMQIDLGGQRMTLVFGDEQAKTNINLLYAMSGGAGSERAVRELKRVSGAAMPVDLRPLAVESADEPGSDPPSEASEGLDLADISVEPVFESWSQVFSGGTTPADLMRRRGTLPSVASNLTCWGDGLLNMRRASRQSITQVCDKVLRPADVSKLLAIRDRDPEFDLWEALEGLELPEARQGNAEQLLTDKSACYSLWIVTRTGGREWYHLSVAEPSASGGATRMQSFEW